jgi:hypothetical protein
MLVNKEGGSLSGLSWIASFIPALRTGLWGISPSGLLGEIRVKKSTRCEGDFIGLASSGYPVY